jgi:hypothetical protein
VRQPVVVLLTLRSEPPALCRRGDSQRVLERLGCAQHDGEIIAAIGLAQKLERLFLLSARAAHKKTGLPGVLRLQLQLEDHAPITEPVHIEVVIHGATSLLSD